MTVPVRIALDRDPCEEALGRGDYRERASRIVDRVLPHLPAANPLYDPEGFRAASIRHGERSRLYWRIFARLRAKAEGGAPYIALPSDCHVLEGSAMVRVARELLTDAELLGLAKGQRKFGRSGL